MMVGHLQWRCTVLERAVELSVYELLQHQVLQVCKQLCRTTFTVWHVHARALEFREVHLKDCLSSPSPWSLLHCGMDISQIKVAKV